MTKRVLMSPRVCTDRCLQSGAVSAAVLPGELTPPLRDLLGQCGSALGQWDPGAAGSHMPCPAHCCAGAELNQSLQKQLTDLWGCGQSVWWDFWPSLWHLQRTDAAPAQCPEQPAALPAASPCSFAWLVLPFPLPCCTTMEWDMSAHRPVTCKQLPVLKQEVQKIHLIALNI